jgi:hypothetical protein
MMENIHNRDRTTTTAVESVVMLNEREGKEGRLNQPSSNVDVERLGTGFAV